MKIDLLSGSSFVIAPMASWCSSFLLSIDFLMNNESIGENISSQVVIINTDLNKMAMISFLGMIVLAGKIQENI